MTPSHYTRKPTVIEAVQVRWSTWNDLCDFVGDTIGPDSPAWFIDADEASDACGEVGPYIAFNVTTVHGELAVVRHGDWVIPDAAPGTFYPCKPDVFTASYDPVE